MSNCSLARAVDGHIMRCRIISSCQWAAISEIVKCSWTCVHRGAVLYQVPDLYVYLYCYCQCWLSRFIVLHVFLTPVPSSFVRPHAQGSLAVWDSEGFILSPLSTAMIVCVYVIAGPLVVVVLQASMSWSALVSLTTLVSVWLYYSAWCLQALIYITTLVSTILRGAYRSWKVMEFKIQIFQA